MRTELEIRSEPHTTSRAPWSERITVSGQTKQHVPTPSGTETNDLIRVTSFTKDSRAHPKGLLRAK